MCKKLVLILALFVCVLRPGDIDNHRSATDQRGATNSEYNIWLPLVTIPPIYYVDGTLGSDANPGTMARPWLTIQKAADTMLAGDTLVVKAGDYSNQRASITHSGNSNSTITYQTQGHVVMKGFLITANYIVIRGFEITKTDWQRWNRQTGAGIYINGMGNIVEENYIHDASLDGIYVDGTSNMVRNNSLYRNGLAGIEVTGKNSMIEGNEIWGTVQCPSSVIETEGISWCSSNMDADGMRFWGSGHIFRGNNIHDIRLGDTINGVNANPSPHIDCFQTFSNGDLVPGKNIFFEQNYCENYDGTSALMLEGGADHLYIRNNIFRTATGISANGAGAGGADYLYIFNNIWVGSLAPVAGEYPSALKMKDINHVWVENNIFYNQGGDPPYFLGSTANTIFDYNLTYNSNGSKQHCVEWGSYDKCIPSALHNLFNVNPQFVTDSNYHLKSNSPAIDTGAPVDVTNDYEGNPRPQGSGYDIGPFEFPGAQAQPSTYATGNSKS